MNNIIDERKYKPGVVYVIYRQSEAVTRKLHEGDTITAVLFITRLDDMSRLSVIDDLKEIPARQWLESGN